MNIALVTSEFPPMNAAAAARLEPWADVFEQRGHDVTILTSREAAGGDSRRVWFSRFGVPSNQFGLARRFLQEIRLGRDLAKELRRRASGLDLAIITSPPFFLATFCAKVARRCALPYSFDVRDRYPGVLFELGLIRRTGFLGRWLSRMERAAYSGAKLISTVTHSLKKELQEVASAQKVFWSPNGFDGALFPKALPDAKKRDSFTVIYHGRFSRLHDVEALRRLVLACGKIDRDICFVVAGPIPEDSRQRDWGTATFLGELSRKDIPGLLAECHLGISLMKPSGATRVAMPAKVFEYWGAGIPVLAAPQGELLDFVRGRKIGLAFDRIDLEAMVEAIFSLKRNPDEWNRMSSRIRSMHDELDRRVIAVNLAGRLESVF